MSKRNNPFNNGSTQPPPKKQCTSTGTPTTPLISPIALTEISFDSYLDEFEKFQTTTDIDLSALNWNCQHLYDIVGGIDTGETLFYNQNVIPTLQQNTLPNFTTMAQQDEQMIQPVLQNTHQQQTESTQYDDLDYVFLQHKYQHFVQPPKPQIKEIFATQKPKVVQHDKQSKENKSVLLSAPIIHEGLPAQEQSVYGEGKFMCNPTISAAISRNWTPQRYTNVTLLFETTMDKLDNVNVSVDKNIAGGRNKKVYQTTNPGFVLSGGLECLKTKVNEPWLSIRKEKPLVVESVPCKESSSKTFQKKLEFEVQLKCSSSQFWERWKDFRITVCFKLQHLVSKEYVEWKFDVISQGNRSILANRRKTQKTNDSTIIYPNELINNMKLSTYREYKPMAQICLGVLQLTLHMKKPSYLINATKKGKSKQAESNKYPSEDSSSFVVERQLEQGEQKLREKGFYPPKVSEWKRMLQLGKEYFNTQGKLAAEYLERCFFYLNPALEPKNVDKKQKIGLIFHCLDKLKTADLGNLDLEILTDIAALHSRIPESTAVKELLSICIDRATEKHLFRVACIACYRMAEYEYFKLKRKELQTQKLSADDIQQELESSFNMCDRQLEYLKQKSMTSMTESDRVVLWRTIADCANLKGVLLFRYNGNNCDLLADELHWKYTSYMTRAALNPWSVSFAQSCNNMAASLSKLIPPLDAKQNYIETLELQHVIKMFRERALYVQGLYPDEKHVAYYLYKRNLCHTHLNIAKLMHKLKNTPESEKNLKKAQTQFEQAQAEYKKYEAEFFLGEQKNQDK